MSQQFLDAFQNYITQLHSFAVSVSSVAGADQTMLILKAGQEMSVAIQKEKKKYDHRRQNKSD